MSLNPSSAYSIRVIVERGAIGLSLRVEYSRWPHLLRLAFPLRLRLALSTLIQRLTPYLVFLVFWHLVAILVQNVRGVPFPTPIDTAIRGVELFTGDSFLGHTIYLHLASSLLRWGAGFVVAAILGLTLGLIATLSPRASDLIIPLAAFLQPVPSLAWIPLAILLLGLGNQSTVFIIFLAGVFPIIISVVAGIKSVPSGLLRAASMMGANRKTTFFKVLLPGSLPHLLSGFRSGLANGWRALIAAEMVGGTDLGLGYTISQCRWSLDYPSAFVAIFIIAVIGLVIERVIFQRIEVKTIEIWGMGNKGGEKCWR